MSVRQRTVSTITVVGLVLGLATALVAATPASAARPGGAYVTVSPTRLLDTRANQGGTGPVTAGHSVVVRVTGTGGVPASGVAAVALNLVAGAPTRTGTLTAYSSGDARPDLPNLSFAAGLGSAHSEVIRPGTDGGVTIHNDSAGDVDLIVDLAGYYTAGTPSGKGAFVPVAPTRVIDSRTGLGVAHAQLDPPTYFKITGVGGVPATGVSAVLVNLTVPTPAHTGWLSWFLSGTDAPTTNLNYTAGRTASTLVVAQVDDKGVTKFHHYREGRDIDMQVDVLGYFTSGAPDQGGMQEPMPPTRLVNTTIAAHSTRALTVTTRGVPAGVSAVSLTVGASSAKAHGWLTIYAGGHARPATSSLNFAYQQSVTNFVQAPVGANGQIEIYNGGAGSVRVAIDVQAYVGAVPGPLSWTDPIAATPGSGAQQISCPSTTSCTAIANGNADTFDGTHWDTSIDIDPGQQLVDVSCPTVAFCAAIDGGGGVVMFHGAAGWGRPQHIADNLGQLQSVSCVSAQLCIAILDSVHYEMYDGSTWSAPAPIAPDEEFTALSCRLADSCLAVGGPQAAGSQPHDIWRYSAGAWTKTATIAVPDDGAGYQNSLYQVDCASANFCVALGVERYSVYRGSSWSELAPMGQYSEAFGLAHVSCAGTTCVAPSGPSAVIRFDGSSWSSSPVPVSTGGDLTGLSCAAADRCVAALFDGASVFDGSSWSPEIMDPNAITLGETESCVSATYCLSTNGRVFDGTSWGAPHLPGVGGHYLPGPGTGARSLSCTSMTFCMLVGTGTSETWTGGGWTAPLVVPGAKRLVQVSCTSSTFCIAEGGSGYTWRYDGTTWIGITTIGPPGSSISNLSCVSSTFCVETTPNSAAQQIEIFDGTKWTPVAGTSDFHPNALSCSSTRSCVVLDVSGQTLVYDGSTWTTKGSANVDRYIGGLSCASATLCYLAWGSGVAAFNGTSWTAFARIDYGAGIETLDCPTTNFCLAVDPATYPESAMYGTRPS